MRNYYVDGAFLDHYDKSNSHFRLTPLQEKQEGAIELVPGEGTHTIYVFEDELSTKAAIGYLRSRGSLLGFKKTKPFHFELPEEPEEESPIPFVPSVEQIEESEILSSSTPSLDATSLIEPEKPWVGEGGKSGGAGATASWGDDTPVAEAAAVATSSTEEASDSDKDEEKESEDEEEESDDDDDDDEADDETV
jgi:hypothetical protein